MTAEIIDAPELAKRWKSSRVVGAQQGAIADFHC